MTTLLSICLFTRRSPASPPVHKSFKPVCLRGTISRSRKVLQIPELYCEKQNHFEQHIVLNLRRAMWADYYITRIYNYVYDTLRIWGSEVRILPASDNKALLVNELQVGLFYEIHIKKRDCRIIAMVPFLCQFVTIQANRQRKRLTAALVSDIITFTTKN